jgi:DmsE family decaheme c-type cytochrome
MKLLKCMITILAFTAGLAGVTPAFAADAAEQTLAKDLVLKGDAKCTRCHDESDSPKVLSIGKNKHGTVADGRTPTCTDCHGESDAHANNPGGKQRPAPERMFTKNTKTNVQQRNGACLSCHEKDAKRSHWAGSIHESRDVACTSCHQIHTAHDKVRDKRTQPEVCFTCHKEQRAQINRVSRHPIPEGKMGCSDCHNPHGSAGPKLMKRDSVVETCYTCHMEKRGPFLWNHQPVTDDCSICHNPHGSNTAGLLKSRAPFLCQQCHEAVGHRGNIPGLNPTGGPLGTATTLPGNKNITSARACLNCHTSIHGSNNPPSTGRSFRN